MNTNDFLIRGLFSREKVRFALAETAGLVADAVRIHDADPAAAQGFADALTATALLKVLLQEKEQYTIRWRYPGKLCSIVADVTGTGEIRGLISEPHLMAQNAVEPDQIYGSTPGSIAVTKSEAGRILNSGETSAPLAQPSADLGFFFCTSDQIETEFCTVCRFHADPANPVHSSAGIMLQALPECDLQQFETLRGRLHTPEVKELLLHAALPLETRLKKLLDVLGIEGEENLRCEADTHIRFFCSCSRQKMQQALQVLGEKELYDLFAQEKEIKIQCRFCCKNYEFQEKDFFQK